MKAKKQVHEKLQVQLLLSQLAALRRELRETLRTYEARLEIALAEIINQITKLKAAKQLQPDQFDRIESLITLLRQRKLTPEKGRRKDLRRIERLITDLHDSLHSA